MKYESLGLYYMCDVLMYISRGKLLIRTLGRAFCKSFESWDINLISVFPLGIYTFQIK